MHAVVMMKTAAQNLAAPKKFTTSCASCNFRELCIPAGVCADDLARVHSGNRRPDAELPPSFFSGTAGISLRVGSLDASQQPHLAAIGDKWAPLAARDIYPEGLRAFVDGLLAQAASTS